MNRHLIASDRPIVNALEQLNNLSGETMNLFVVDGEGRLVGSLTDGDVRRALLAGHGLQEAVGNICNRRCLALPGADIAEARRRNVVLLPVLEDGKIVRLIDLRKQRGLIPADGVLMAGGKGERLRPLTETTPKPLLPVAGRPIIDHNVELMHEFGIENIFVTVNYLKEQLISHFSGTPGVECIAEPKRLGTIGSLALIDALKAPDVVVMNADLLTDINLEAMYLKHIETEAWLTMAVIPYTVSVPFAIVRLEGDAVKGLTEKPTYNYYANAGIYIIRREAMKDITPGEYLDATDFVERLLEEGKRVSLFHLTGRWIDIGSPDDYRHACGIERV